MEILRSTSFIWSLMNTLLFFLLLFESRYSTKKTAIIALSTMMPLILLNLPLCYLLDANSYGVLMLLTLSLPSLIVFWILAQKRDGRFLFTFCMADTVGMELTYVTQILNYYVTPHSNVFLFVSRLLIFPICSLLIYKYLRPIYHQIQRGNRHGWSLFAIIGFLFYIVITLMMNYPTAITERPSYYPALVLMFILMPIVYMDIIITLKHQLDLSETKHRESILQLQAENMAARVEELSKATEHFREERHNFRHKMKTISSLAHNKQYNALEDLLDEYSEAMNSTQIVRYCNNAVLDAVISAYSKQAEGRGIRISYGFDFPDPIPVNTTEFATVLANALENAIQACDKLPPEERFIEMRVLSRPRFMLMIKNSFNGTIQFDENDIPINREDGHGFGTRTIIAFCEKHRAFYRFVAEGKEFALYLNFQQIV